MKQQYQLISDPKPFVKWAGGKRQLLPVITSHIPSKFERYFEPFLGGGAVFFSLVAKERKAKWFISDLNSDLALSYVTIRDRVKELVLSLENHAANYTKNQSSYYYKVREANPKNEIDKVSRLIFLNKTCFNGLYRVNSKGKFNVPVGRYVNPNIVNKENLFEVSRVLQSKDISIKCQDFEDALKGVGHEDFVYLDPPYQPVSTTSSFTSYTDSNFDFSDQERLYAKFKALDKKGVKVLLSNSRSDEIIELFSEFSDGIIEINANRFINSVSQKRTGHTELLIKNY
ncbi:MAG TPA: Dam family site-specific DNA-(adenine-N6)-methyltransferase [Candidatus Nitrosotalea sp.]|nr:Dam family site-specific DNA-(adenine-N6)-methyltransferase [Candidatus Nitrosotalea sp.]